MPALPTMLKRLGLTRSQGREADFCGVSDPVVLDSCGGGLVEGVKPVAMLGTATRSWAEAAYDSVPAVNTACNVPAQPAGDLPEACAMAPYAAGGIVAHTPAEQIAAGAAYACHVYVDPEGNVATLAEAEGVWQFTEPTVIRAARARLASLRAYVEDLAPRQHPWLNIGRAGPGMWWWEVVSTGGLAVLDDGEATTWHQALAVGQAALAQALYADALAVAG